MPKKITANQIIGEIGENQVRGRFLALGYQFDGRSRLEAGIDGIAEVMTSEGQPMARMIAVQVKSTAAAPYASEDDSGFTYLLRSEDLAYWKGSNLPVILVFYRQSDNSFYWKEVSRDGEQGDRRLIIDKVADVLDSSTVNKLAALTVPKTGLGYFVPPLGGGEEALVNMLPITLPGELYLASTPYDSRRAMAMMFDGGDERFDWVINGGTFWSFQDPRTTSCHNIVDLDQVEAIDTKDIAFHDDVNEQNKFSFLLRQTLRHQTEDDLGWSKEHKALYFRARDEGIQRNFAYEASRKKTDAGVVSVFMDSKVEGRISFVRHHAFIPRFENIGDEWYLIVTPTYHFTTNGFSPHLYAAPLLSGKKRLDKSAALRGQVIMWHRFLTEGERVAERDAADLFGGQQKAEPRLQFGKPPSVHLEIRVPEDGWGSEKRKEQDTQKEGLFANGI